MKMNYFFVFAFFGLFSVAITVAAECPVDDRGIKIGKRLPGSARERAYFLEKQLYDRTYKSGQKSFLDRTFKELDAQGHKNTYRRLAEAEKYNAEEEYNEIFCRARAIYDALEEQEQRDKRKRNESSQHKHRRDRNKRKRTQ